MSSTTHSRTLRDALLDTLAGQWRGTRSEARNLSQSIHAIKALERVVLGSEQPMRSGGPSVSPAPIETRKIAAGGFTFTISRHAAEPSRATRPLPGAGLLAAAVTTAQVRTAVGFWLKAGLAATTIRVRLSCLGALGVSVKGCYPKPPRKLKWWLRPEQQEVALTWLRAHPSPRNLQLADLIEWTVLVGLRIEESLRLTWSDVLVRPTHWAISVPGTKTSGSQATLPLSADAKAVLERLRRHGSTSGRIFPLPYHDMAKAWREVRLHIGLDGDPKTATLKAMRRTAARALTVNGMPVQMLKDYLSTLR